MTADEPLDQLAADLQLRFMTLAGDAIDAIENFRLDHKETQEMTAEELPGQRGLSHAEWMAAREAAGRRRIVANVAFLSDDLTGGEGEPCWIAEVAHGDDDSNGIQGSGPDPLAAALNLAEELVCEWRMHDRGVYERFEAGA